MRNFLRRFLGDKTEDGKPMVETVTCLVGNIKESKGEGTDWKGTRHFNRGQKIYLLHGKGTRIFVMGRHRQKHFFVKSWISGKHTQNWRIRETANSEVLKNICYDGFRYKGIHLDDVRIALNSTGEWPFR